MKGLKPKVDFKKQPYAEPKFMLPPDSDKLPPPFESLMQKLPASNPKAQWSHYNNSYFTTDWEYLVNRQPLLSTMLWKLEAKLFIS